MPLILTGQYNSGWIKPTLITGCVQTTTDPVFYSMVNRTVYLRGRFKTSTHTSKKVFVIPSGFRTNYGGGILCVTSGAGISQIFFAPTGDISFFYISGSPTVFVTLASVFYLVS